MFDQTISAYGQVDVVVHCAGIMPLAPIAKGDVEMFDHVISTNLRGTFLVFCEAAKHIADGGRIIAFSSSVLVKAFPTYGAYVASKAGVEGLVHVLANELGKRKGHGQRRGSPKRTRSPTSQTRISTVSQSHTRRTTMKLDELLNALFPAGHDTHQEANGILSGTATYGDGKKAAVLGVVDQTPLGADGALALAGHLLDVLRNSPGQPVVTVLDGKSQLMHRRDEMLGLNEYLAHLTKCYVLAGKQGHRTVGVLFGQIAAGAFISTGLAQGALVAVPGGDPVRGRRTTN